MASSPPENRHEAPSAPRKTSAGTHALRILLITALLVGSLWYAVRDVNWGDLWRSVLSANLFWTLAAAAITLLAHLARAERWRHLIPDGRKIGLLNAFSATVIGYFMNNIVPRSGEVGRPYVLAKREGRSASGLIATVVVERILDGVTLLAILVGIIFIASNELTGLLREIPQLSDYTPGDLIRQLGIPVGGLVLLLILVLGTPLGDRLVDVLAKILPEKIGGKIHTIFDEFRAGAKFSGGLVGLLGVIFWTLVIWFGYILSLHCGILAFGFDRTYGMDFGDSTVLLGITAIGMALAPTPGGFGVFHTFCRITLVSLYGVPVDQAVAFAFVLHFAQYASAMIAGPIFAIREGTGWRRIMK